MLRKTLQNFIFNIICTIKSFRLFWDQKQKVDILKVYYFLKFNGSIATFTIGKNPEDEIN